jgi:hypothetical protein
MDPVSMLGMSFVVGGAVPNKVPVLAAFIYFFYALPLKFYIFFTHDARNIVSDAALKGAFPTPHVLDAKEMPRKGRENYFADVWRLSA